MTALASKTPVAKHGKGTKPEHDYVIADLSLKDWGRKEIAIVEHEMPGLMAIRKKYVGTQALKGARIAGSLHMTIQTAVLIETLQALGADIRCGRKGVVSHCFCRNCAVFLDAGLAVAHAVRRGIVAAADGETSGLGVTPTANGPSAVCDKVPEKQ
jgi:hypothetical protein